MLDRQAGLATNYHDARALLYTNCAANVSAIVGGQQAVSSRSTNCFVRPCVAHLHARNGLPQTESIDVVTSPPQWLSVKTSQEHLQGRTAAPATQLCYTQQLTYMRATHVHPCALIEWAMGWQLGLQQHGLHSQLRLTGLPAAPQASQSNPPHPRQQC